MASSNLVITEEVFLPDEDQLIELTIACETTTLYDTLIRMSNVISKNAKSQNHIEDVLNNLKLFVETNVGKLTRQSTLLDESSRSLHAQVLKLQEDLRVTREQMLRKEEYELDIRRVKSQLSPCVSFLEDVAQRKSYSLDLYIRELLQADIPAVYLKPLLADVQGRIMSAVDHSMNVTKGLLAAQNEEFDGVLTRNLDRVNVELRSMKELTARIEVERELSRMQLENQQKGMTQSIEDKLAQLQKTATEQSQRVKSELDTLDVRHKKIVELLGFRESISTTSPNAMQSLIPPAMHTMLGMPSSAAMDQRMSSSTGSDSMSAEETLMLHAVAAAAGENGNFLPVIAFEGSARGRNASLLQGGGDANGTQGATSPPPGTTSELTMAEAAAGITHSLLNPTTASENVSMSSSGVSTRSPAAISGRSIVTFQEANAAAVPSQQQQQVRSAVSGGGGGTVKLVARGKSILQVSDPEQGTGMFGTQLFQTMIDHVNKRTDDLIMQLEDRVTSKFSGALVRMESQVRDKIDEPTARALLPSARDATLYQMMDAVNQAIEQLKKKKADITFVNTSLAGKADRTAMESKVDKMYLDAIQSQVDYKFNELSAAMLQAQHVIRNSEKQLNVFHDALADQGILMANYNSGDGGGAAAGGGDGVKGSSLPQPSRLGSSSGKSGASGGFPQPYAGVNDAAKKPPIPGSAGGKHGNKNSPTSSRDVEQKFIPPNSGGSGSSSKVIRSGGSSRNAASSSPGQVPPSTMLNSTTSSTSNVRGENDLPLLHEVVFEMKDEQYLTLREKSSREGRPLVAPRPPSTPR